MQPLQRLKNWLYENIDENHYIFSHTNMRSLFPNLSDPAYKTMLTRAVNSGILIRGCRGIYLSKESIPLDGLLLFRIASIIRANYFNYISLETALSDSGVISQIPINWISIMSSGRSNIISCGDFGTIEFVHTSQSPLDLKDKLIYDHRCGLWRANTSLAIRDMKCTHRNMDLINWDIANELI